MKTDFWDFYSDSDKLFKYKVNRSLTTESKRRILTKTENMENLVKRVIQGSGLIQTPLVGIYNSFEENSDHLAENPLWFLV